MIVGSVKIRTHDLPFVIDVIGYCVIDSIKNGRGPAGIVYSDEISPRHRSPSERDHKKRISQDTPGRCAVNFHVSSTSPQLAAAFLNGKQTGKLSTGFWS